MATLSSLIVTYFLTAAVFASSAQGDTKIRFQPHAKQGSGIEAYYSRPDTLPLGMLKAHGRTFSVPTTDKFFVTVKWYVKGYGHLWLEADNAGRFYSADQRELLLNFEFARSRVLRNRDVLERYQRQDFRASASVLAKQRLAEQSLLSAQNATDEKGKALFSDQALARAIVAGEELELAWAAAQQSRPNFKRPIFGVDGRHYLWAKSEDVDHWVPKLFELGTITHYVRDSWFPSFEPREGDLRWGTKIEQYDWLKANHMQVEARPIFWPHEWVTPKWLLEKDFPALKEYVIKHATAMVGFWGNRITKWEVVNEMHDWANVHQLSAEQITELVKLACDTVRKLQPNATLIINNTMIFGEYAGMRWDKKVPAGRPIRTPYLFIKDLIEAGVDFDVIGLQVYHPERDLSDMVRLLEKFETFGKEIVISEIGAPSEGDGVWKERPWSPKIQADWAEQIYRVSGTRPSVKGLFWYDITDFRSFVPGGGVLTEDGKPKEVYNRLMNLKKEWDPAK